MYATRGWASTGVAVEDGVSGERLGAVMLALHARPSVGTSPRERSPWQVFCEDVVGVTMLRYGPEKRVRAYLSDGVWNVVADSHDPDAEIRRVPAADGPAALGATLLGYVESLAPRWPMVRRVMIFTTATGRLVVMPNIGAYTVGPARVADPDERSLLPVVREAFADADAERTGAPEYRQSLVAAGVDPHWLHGNAEVTLDELSDGTVEIKGAGCRRNRYAGRQETTGRIDGLAAVCAEVARMIPELPNEHLPPGTPTGARFGFKCSWLAVRGGTTEEVADAVGLDDRVESDWDEGVESAYDRKVFVSPPTGGWVFVVGQLLDLGGRSVAWLSGRLGTEVQYFGSYRVSDTHQWAYAIGGRLVRRMFYDGCSGTFEQEGPLTPVEAELDVPAAVSDDWSGVSERDVMRVADAWSIDPNTLDLVESSGGKGLVGAVTRSDPPSPAR
ncbi:hypothetical protein CLV67_119140 [Actinoplanes italicus]|uniref:Uncharacterized protein n=2 Tax=Actinoplanes italicus TaxID=113567 RepID=A0A2T0K185_9ACTN|nr:hypothetical protein CLV67_119140 [Actinoplanes italicus]